MAGRKNLHVDFGRTQADYANEALDSCSSGPGLKVNDSQYFERKDWCVPKLSEEDEQHVYYINNFLISKSERDGLYADLPDLECPFKNGNCEKCHRASINVCSRCQAWYCSFPCFVQDWSKHKYSCIPRTRVFSPEGHISYKTDEYNLDGAIQSKQGFQLVHVSKSECEQVNDQQGEIDQRNGDIGILKQEQRTVKHPNPQTPPKLPLPYNTFTEVLISWADEDNVYWVYKLKNLAVQAEIAQALDGHCNDPNVKPDPDLVSKCCALFDGEWYRGKILDKDSTTAKVLFVDFGNVSEVPLDQIKPLPKSLASKRPMAFKIRFLEGTSLTEFEEDAAVKVKPVRMDNDICLVQLEGDTAISSDKFDKDDDNCTVQLGGEVAGHFESEQISTDKFDKDDDTCTVQLGHELAGPCESGKMPLSTNKFDKDDDTCTVPLGDELAGPCESEKMPLSSDKFDKDDDTCTVQLGHELAGLCESEKMPLSTDKFGKDDDTCTVQLGGEVAGHFESEQMPLSTDKFDKDDDTCTVQLGGEVAGHFESEPMPLSTDKFEKVQIMEGSADEYWAILESNSLTLLHMTRLLDVHKTVSVEPKLNETYVAEFEEAWCRAKVTKLNPLTVQFIDFGNEILIEASQLHPVPIDFKDMKPMAIKLKLAPGTPEKYFNLTLLSVLSVKATKMTQDKAVVVQIEGEMYASVCEYTTFPRRSHSSNTVQKRANHLLYMTDENDKGISIQINKVVGENCLCGTLILKSSSCQDYKTNEEISELLSSESVVDPEFKPELGASVSCKLGKSWCRGYVMTQKRNLKVGLVDYGQVVKPDVVAPMPQKVKLIAEAAVRCVFNKALNKLSEMVGETLLLTEVKKELGKLTAIVGNQGSAEITPWEPLIKEAGLKVSKLKNKSKVIISAYQTPKSIYLRSANEADLRKFAKLFEYVTLHCSSAPPLGRNPWCGEFVCCKFDEDDNYYRAQVFKKVNDKYMVNFVDYGNIETVDASSMKPMSDSLKTVRCAAIKVGLKDVPGTHFNASALRCLYDICESGTVYNVMFENNDLSGVILEKSDGGHLNVMLCQLMMLSWTILSKTPAPTCMGGEIVYDKWRKGQKVEISIALAMSYKNILAIDTSSSTLAYVVNDMTPRINTYCSALKESYTPKPNEVCLAKYVDEAEGSNWCRALCITTTNNTSDVFYIDYGDSGEVYHEDIRKMSPDFMDTPAVLKQCQIYGLEGLSEDFKVELTKKLVGATYNSIVVEDHGDGNAIIFIPEINYLLKSTNMPPIVPPPEISHLI